MGVVKPRILPYINSAYCRTPLSSITGSWNFMQALGEIVSREVHILVKMLQTLVITLKCCKNQFEWFINSQ